MTDHQFFDWQTDGGGNDVVRFVSVLEEHAMPWCMIGGGAVNHWATEPMVTQDVELVVALDRVYESVTGLASIGFKARSFPHSVNLEGTSRVTVQLSTDAMYRDFPSRSVPAEILTRIGL